MSENDSETYHAMRNVLMARYSRKRSSFLPWEQGSAHTVCEQTVFKDILREKAGADEFGENSFVSPEAHVYTYRFRLGRNSWVAGGAILRGQVLIGSNSTINPFCHIAGKVEIGDGVRIAGLVAIYGFNHGYDRVDIPIYQQVHTSKGIVIGDGVWIGTNAVILDGVTIGAHSIIAAGAVITKDVPAYSIAGGNPARTIKSRIE